jgi:hypothetical protein
MGGFNGLHKGGPRTRGGPIGLGEGLLDCIEVDQRLDCTDLLKHSPHSLKAMLM